MSDAPNLLTAAGVTVTSAGNDLLAARDEALADNAGLAAAIMAKDASLWGPDAATEAALSAYGIDALPA